MTARWTIFRCSARLTLAAAAVLLAGVGAVAPAAAAPPPRDVGTTRAISAQWFESYAGQFLVVKARDTAATELSAEWFADGVEAPQGTAALVRSEDGGVYLHDSVLVPVAGRPDHVVVRRDADNWSRIAVTDWATPSPAPPPGYRSDFQTGYLDPDDAADRVADLASEFPSIAERLTLPMQTDGYQRRSQMILGTDPNGTLAAVSAADAARAVVLTSVAVGQSGGDDVSVRLLHPAAANAPLSVSTAGDAITVSLATDGAGAVTSTAAQVTGLLNASGSAAALVSAATYRGNAGAGIVAPTSGFVALTDALHAPATVARGPRQMAALRIGGVRDGSRPGVLVTAGFGGDERVTPLVALELAERLLRNYGTDAETTALVDALDIFIVPAANPDGALYSFYDSTGQRRNMRSHCAPGGLTDPAARGQWGVAIDRNFTVGSLFDGFAGAATSCTSDLFSGPFEASEPETRNLLWLLSTFPNIRFAADVRASGGTVTWSPGAYASSGRVTLPRPPWLTQRYLDDLAGRIASRVARSRGTALVPTDVGAATEVLGSRAGNLVDEAHYAHGVLALGIEVGVDRMDASGRRTPVGRIPAFTTEGGPQAQEFADGLIAVLEAARAYADDTAPPDVTTTPGPHSSPDPIEVRFRSDEPAAIHYTLDGSTPTLASPQYAPTGPFDPVAPLRIDSSTTLKWIAVDIRGNVSAVRSATYELRGRDTPPESPPVESPPADPPHVDPPLEPFRAPLAIAALEPSARCVGSRRGAARDVRVRVTLSEPARVTLRLQRRVPPGRLFRFCPRPGPASGPARYVNRIPTGSPRPQRRSRRAGRAPRAVGSATRRGRTRTVSRTLSRGAGEHRIALLRTLRAGSLAPGRYRVVLEATTADGRRSNLAIVYLRVLAR
ncbi:M14 family zinc carboxypeptidase [Conexibacter arvalis]|uniref:Peptidase M14 domain-containing protein n=1 Tax=Conexibacter arvalis TaxID=912552 RepID=A0A840IEU7_9ACTN|nr:M14 family zinc carboxypeptidase [Conexibacter arvalis]MBB4663336.1 hypothetical protein [Conexibacter arvalis]